MDEVKAPQLLRTRRELVFLPIDDAASERWCVFDPVSRQSYRVGWREKWLLCNAKVWQSPQQLVQSFLHNFHDQRDAANELLDLVIQLANAELLQLKKSATSLTAQTSNTAASLRRSTNWLSKLVVFQVRGFQPQRLLQCIAPHTNILFSVQAVGAWITLAMLALVSVLLNFERLSAEIGAEGFWLRPAVGGSLFVVFILTRGLHELGHALVCTRFGIRCPDIGLFVILGAPCVYCDVSESWKLTERWKRAAVAAAGMYVELIIASLAAIFWCCTRPGPLNSLAMQTMLVCSVGTLLINLNPLMRFDGYYMLADWMDEANLRSKSDAVAMSIFRQRLLGIRSTTVAMKKHRRMFFLIFSIAGFIYRTILSITIASVVVALFSNWYLPWIGRGLAATILVTWWSRPIMKFADTFLQHFAASRLRVASLSLCLLAFILVAPLPNRRMAQGWIEPTTSSGVYVQNAGQLKACFVEDGERVEAGEKLFQLASSELELERINMEHRLNSAETKLLHATYENELDPTHDAGVSRTDAENARTRLNDAVARAESLTCVAPVSGKMVSFQARPALGPWAPEIRTEARHTSWCEAEQLGRTIPAGTLVGAVCSDRSQAVIPLKRGQLLDVRVGTVARVRITHEDMTVVESEVKAIVPIDSLDTTWRPQNQDDETQARRSKYAVIIELPENVSALPGSSVDVVFLGQPTRLATRIYRWTRTNLSLLSD